MTAQPVNTVQTDIQIIRKRSVRGNQFCKYTQPCIDKKLIQFTRGTHYATYIVCVFKGNCNQKTTKPIRIEKAEAP